MPGCIDTHIRSIRFLQIFFVYCLRYGLGILWKDLRISVCCRTLGDRIFMFGLGVLSLLQNIGSIIGLFWRIQSLL